MGRCMGEGLDHPTAMGLACGGHVLVRIVGFARTYWASDVSSVGNLAQAAKWKSVCEGLDHPTAVVLAVQWLATTSPGVRHVGHHHHLSVLWRLQRLPVRPYACA
ncbi:unnamed protein product [Prorocentrum cordatum]|uniref:Uncharacterized protein n=1 Tax=Prorocentrum cordatum TaxID=2364126 RepID=A0ABN9SL92_9DINO|nr:unnamed protein product [Polarella glacialis]